MEHGIIHRRGRGSRTWGLLGGLGLLVWFGVVVLPLGWLFLSIHVGNLPTAETLSVGRYGKLLGRSLGSAALIATVSVLAGWPAGRLIGANRWARQWGPLLLMIPLLIPPHILYYSLGLLLLPTSRLGMTLSRSETVIGVVQAVRSLFSLALWYWPLCGLILGTGWRRTDPDLWLASSLDAGGLRRWWTIGFPMLRGVLVLAWLLVFVLALSQYGVFLLSAVDTVGTELGVLYQLTGNVHTVAWAALPLVVPAALTAVVMDRFLRPTVQSFDLPNSERCWRGHWVLAGVLWLVSTVAPIVLLAGNVHWDTFARLSALTGAGLLCSAGIALGAAALAVVVALSIVVQSQAGGHRRAVVMRLLTFVVALVPGSLVAVALVYAFNRGWLAEHVYNQPWIISLGHAAQLGVPAVLVMRWMESSLPAELGELARLDGARGWEAVVHVWLPGLWPGILAAVLLTMVLSVTELSMTMVLLPAGVPNFAQELLNQMHYARDQQVIASCLLLIGCGAAVAVVLFGLLGLSRWRGSNAALLLAMLVCLGGCDRSAEVAREPKVVGCFGTAGRGEAQFIYPRGVAVAADDTFFVVDKTARIQHLTREGRYIGGWTMPQFQVGKPIGMRCGGNGNLYVADTHYHRVMVYAFDGRLVRQFGGYGTGPGQFIYPTDVEIGPDGRIFVSEYGGNDRVSVFTPAGKFIEAFGSPGEGPNQFSRPSALCLDAGRKVLYVADACNHRIVRYDLTGKFLGVMGGVGTLPGQLRYPYDVSLLKDGTLMVAEYGGNRIQRFGADGKCLGVWGRSGREPGQLFYPWGAGTDSHGRVIVVDSGNNRIQVWQIL